MTQSTKRRLKNNLSCYLMGGLPILGFVVFGMIPIVISLSLGFNSFSRLDFSDMTYVGMDNYSAVLADPLFRKSIVNTLYSLVSLPISMVLGLLIANVLTQKVIKGKKFFRALFFIPFICSTVAVTIIFKGIFDKEYGIVNSVFGTDINFFLNSKLFMPVIILIMTWTSLGFYIILFQAALTGVNQSTLEAAEIDGAGPIKKFFNITLPAISPTTFYLVVTGIIGGLQNFTWFQIICGPLYKSGLGYGPDNSGITVVYYLFVKAFGTAGTDIYGGLAAASAWILAAGIFILTIFNFVVSKKWVHYED